MPLITISIHLSVSTDMNINCYFTNFQVKLKIIIYLYSKQTKVTTFQKIVWNLKYYLYNILDMIKINNFPMFNFLPSFIIRYNHRYPTKTPQRCKRHEEQKLHCGVADENSGY